MPTYQVTQQITVPEEQGRVYRDTRLQVTVGAPDREPTEISSSSSAWIEFPESSSSSNVDYAIFLYRQVDGVEQFLRVCYPLDFIYPIDTPDPATGLYRKSTGDWMFRAESILDQFSRQLLEDIQSLADVLETLAELQAAEIKIYDFSPDGSSMSRYFQLHKDAVTPYPEGDPVGYRLKVTCTGAGTDAKIFLHRNDVAPDIATDDQLARPIAVCSAGDLVDYPADAPDNFPYHYRLATFDIVSKNISLLWSTWENICVDTDELARTLKIMEDDVTSTSEDIVS